MAKEKPEKLLEELREYLSTALESGVMKLTRRGGDGRIDSQDNERQISHALKLHAISSRWQQTRGLAIELAPDRHWFDFEIKGNGGLFIPVNVKVSALRTSDNLSSKEGVFYALTGVDPASVNINDWERFCEQLALHLGTVPEADYYFMVISKTTPGDVFWTSLKRIRELVPNGNNPPFQCKWKQNRDHATRSEAEAREYVLQILHETFVLRAKALESFERHLTPLMTP